MLASAWWSSVSKRRVWKRVAIFLEVGAYRVHSLIRKVFKNAAMSRSIVF